MEQNEDYKNLLSILRGLNLQLSNEKSLLENVSTYFAYYCG